MLKKVSKDLGFEVSMQHIYKEKRKAKKIIEGDMG